MTNQKGRPVVVGVDGSDTATAAAVYAAWEAQRYGVPVRLVYAERLTPTWGPIMAPVTDEEWERDWIRHMMTTVTKAIAEAYPTVAVTSQVVTGSPAAALVAASNDASLLVLGTQSSTGIGGHLAGSVAAQVAAHSRVPVIVARHAKHATRRGQRVVVGLDGSPESQKALAYAVEEALARGVPLEAVYAWSEPGVHDEPVRVGPDIDLSEASARATRNLAEAVAGWADKHPDLKITYRAIHSNDPAGALANAALDASLIVVGSRGHGGFLNLRLGSTVDALIRSSQTPVAVVRGE